MFIVTRIDERRIDEDPCPHCAQTEIKGNVLADSPAFIIDAIVARRAKQVLTIDGKSAKSGIDLYPIAVDGYADHTRVQSGQSRFFSAHPMGNEKPELVPAIIW